MATVISCPNCKNNAKVDDQLLGQNLVCSRCKHVFSTGRPINTSAYEPPIQSTSRPPDERAIKDQLWAYFAKHPIKCIAWTAVILFVGSAMIAGILNSGQRPPNGQRPEPQQSADKEQVVLTPPPEESSESRNRMAWANTSYDVTLRHIDGKHWTEFSNKTGKEWLKYEEKSRTADYVELYCPERTQTIRVRARKMELNKDGKWEWLANGEWVDSSPRIKSVDSSPPVKRPETEWPSAIDYLTMEHYKRIAIGMTEPEVDEILGGPGEEQASSSIGQGTQFEVNTKLVMWSGFLKSISVTFQNGKVTLKAQFGVK